jgi:hypothetical protein
VRSASPFIEPARFNIRAKRKTAIGTTCAALATQEDEAMAEKQTRKRVRRLRREGKSPSTQAGEFVREEIHHIREGKHGARSTKQAIAIGLSKARRSGVRLRVPKPGSVAPEAREQAKRDLARGGHRTGSVSARRSRASTRALRREGHEAASSRALARQASSSARKRRSRGRRDA